MKENRFQARLIQDIRERLPGSIVIKNDANYIQGIPDLTVLYEDRWACLEVKRSLKAAKRPNQEFYIHRMNKMSFARFVTPENKEEVLHDLERSLRA